MGDPHMSKLDSWITVAEAAEAAGISLKHIRHLIEVRGLVQARMFEEGKCVRLWEVIRAVDVERRPSWKAKSRKSRKSIANKRRSVTSQETRKDGIRRGNLAHDSYTSGSIVTPRATTFVAQRQLTSPSGFSALVTEADLIAQYVDKRLRDGATGSELIALKTTRSEIELERRYEARKKKHPRSP